MVHKLKCWPEYFEAVLKRQKNFEVRQNDRNFQVGDMLELFEYRPEKGYTDRACARKVTYILDDPQFVKEGYVVMSIE